MGELLPTGAAPDHPVPGRSAGSGLSPTTVPPSAVLEEELPSPVSGQLPDAATPAEAMSRQRLWRDDEVFKATTAIPCQAMGEAPARFSQAFRGHAGPPPLPNLK